MKNLITLIALLLAGSVNQASAQNQQATAALVITLFNDDGDTLLQWNTQKEINSSYFLIERSADNRTFTTIGRVKAAGYSVNPRSYKFDGISAAKQNTYYRVTLVAMDGERSSSLAVHAGSLSSEDVLVAK